MERAKVVLIGLFFLVAGALIFVFRYKKNSEAMSEKMAQVRASRGLKKYVESENLNSDEKNEDTAGQKSE